MKKKILSLAFVAASLFAFSSFAATPETASTGCSKESTSCCMKQGRSDKKDSKGKRHEGRRGKPGKGAQRDEMAAFEGINLTDTQKASLTKLHNERRAARQAARNASDSTAAHPDRRQARLDYFKAVSVILSPDQYVTFLENVAAGPARPAQSKMNGQHANKQKKSHGDKQQSAKNSPRRPNKQS